MLGIHNKSTSSADKSVESYSIILLSCIVLRKGGGLKFPLCVGEVAWAY